MGTFCGAQDNRVPSPITHSCEQATPPSVPQCLLCEVRTHSSGRKPLEKGHSRCRAIVCSPPSTLLTSPVPRSVNRGNRGNLSPTCLHCTKLKAYRVGMVGDAKARSVLFRAGGFSSVNKGLFAECYQRPPRLHKAQSSAPHPEKAEIKGL